MSEYEDKEIVCAEPGCGTFIWRAQDQAYYAEKGFTPPKRCRPHAQARRKFFDEHPEKVGGWQKRGGKPRDRIRARSDAEDFGI